MRAVLCTHNAHKVDELRDLLPMFNLNALGAAEELPPETGATFLDNARIKALAGAALHPGTWAIADDSGIAVDALGGAPGVKSARFAGERANDAENVALLLDRLANLGKPADRTARFVCVLVAIAPDGSELRAEGVVEGTIALTPTGTNGFGYDPVFIPAGECESFGVLPPRVKQQLSHRGHAARLLASQIGGSGNGGSASGIGVGAAQ